MKAEFEFQSITSGYADTVVIREISGHLGAGQVLGILGRNGVGKTTLLKALSGFLPLMGGAVTWQGEDLSTIPSYARLNKGIAYAPQENIVFGDLSVRDNLFLHLSDKKQARYDYLLSKFPRLNERMNQRAGALSGGERKLLSFVRTMGLAMPLSLLDEPTEGVQPENIDLMAALIVERKLQGASFIVVEQNLSFIEKIADNVCVLDHGDLVLEGDITHLGREEIERHLVV
ncbi:MAG: ATP-binding cassette domain-containing protein [Limnohabitans sp.]